MKQDLNISSSYITCHTSNYIRWHKIFIPCSFHVFIPSMIEQHLIHIHFWLGHNLSVMTDGFMWGTNNMRCTSGQVWVSREYVECAASKPYTPRLLFGKRYHDATNYHVTMTAIDRRVNWWEIFLCRWDFWKLHRRGLKLKSTVQCWNLH